MKTLLERWNYPVRVVGSGADALAAADSFAPKLAFVDIGLPDMDGCDVAEKLRRHPAAKDAILVALTGHSDLETVRRCREVGFDHHLVKPVGMSELQSFVQNKLRERRAP